MSAREDMRDGVDRLPNAAVVRGADGNGAPGSALRLRTLAEVLADTTVMTPPEPVLPPFAFRGRVTLISAREKIGKSTLVGEGAAALSRGEPFLDYEPVTNPATVLWLAIDEPLGDAARRLERHGASPTRLVLCDDRPTADELRDGILAVKPSLVVVDTLSELWSADLEHERDANAVARFLRPFVTVARETDTALVLLYHTKKNGTEYRGSVALGATVDAVLTLRPGVRPGRGDDSDAGASDSDDGSRLIEGTTRWGRVRMKLAFEGGRYIRVGALPPLRDRALRALYVKSARSASTLAETLCIRKDRALELVDGLIADGLVIRAGKLLELTANGVGAAVKMGVGPGEYVDPDDRQTVSSATQPAEPGDRGIGSRNAAGRVESGNRPETAASADVRATGSRSESPGRDDGNRSGDAGAIGDLFDEADFVQGGRLT